MNNSTIIDNPLTNFQFLSVCHYITGFSYFLYNKHLIKLNEQTQTITVINVLFNYISNSKNESNAKLEILKKILKGTDLYGGGENETLDIKYIYETYHYIINTALFFEYGNINRYLAGIINKLDKINYFDLKKKVFEEFSQNYNTRDYCSLGNENFNLTLLAKRKIFDDFIWSIFPLPSENMSIIDVRYIYAMVGLKFISTTLANRENLTFDDYTLIGREINTQSIDNNTYSLILELFSAPALFFYAFINKEEFRRNSQSYLKNRFWIDIYEKLINYMNNAMNNILSGIIRSTIYYKLENEMQNLKTRTSIAYDILKVFCNYDNFAQVSSLYVDTYKTLFLWIVNYIRPERCDKLPDLEHVYDKQFTNVEKTYFKLERIAIEKVLTDGNLTEKLNENVTVWFARVPDYPMYHPLIPPSTRKINNDIYLLFAIVENKKEEFYAFKQMENGLSLLRCSGNEQEFAKAVANNSYLKMEKSLFSITLKHLRENYKFFIERVANIKTKQFVKSLKSYFFEKTVGEKILNFIKSLIPFYNCIDYIRDDNKALATFSCSLDMITLIPIVGFTAKYATIFQTILMREIIQNSLIKSIISNVKNLVFISTKSLLKEIFKITKKISDEILTKAMFIDLGLASLRTVDPGFEAIYTFCTFSITEVWKLFQYLIKNIKITPLTRNLISIMKSILKKNINIHPDHTGLVPKILAKGDNFHMVKYYYPGGSNFFGPTCLTSFGKTAELRSIEGYPFQLPVVPIKSNDKIFYKEYSPNTGKMLNNEFELNNNILRNIKYLLELIVPQNKKIVKNYEIYYNTIEWNSPSNNKDFGDYVLLRQENSRNPGTSIGTNNVAQIDNFPSAGDYVLLRQENSRNPGTSIDTNNVAQIDNFPSAGDYVSLRQENSRNPGISNSIVNTNNVAQIDNIPSTSRGYTRQNNFAYVKINEILKTPYNPNGYLHEFGNSDYDKFISQLNKFKTGLSSLRKNGELRNFKLAIDRVNSMQMTDAMEKPIELYYTEVKKQHIIRYLKNLQGKEFFFNDLTLLTSNNPIIVKKTEELFPIHKTVKYHLNFDNQYGIINLGKIHEMFQNNYIVFSEVKFKVKYIIEDKSTNSLILKMDKIPLTRDKWIEIRNNDLKLTAFSRNLKKTERLQNIEAAAEFLSSNVPLYTYTESKNLLRQYILKIKTSNTDVPTYEKMAYDIYNNLKIPNFYNNFKIKNQKFIDDVLFDVKLQQTDDLYSASEKIHKILSPIGLKTCTSSM
ncbi:uncharacterized protein LOC127290059 isoform X2 [Leptopilina boulardi]|uniref:uncharacterized protein LOC127290059 isoform X2 n=1 Tax=Leptopilina boulardi TaxID=63433 RepID=UPI0021F53AD9|nr:uncharacterized protein LOC127290059 isoform X2 [Leptopilina boulardi]